MNKPAFTTDPHRVARLQENYDEGVARERIPCEVRERVDVELLAVSREKLKFLFQNAMESYAPEVKNAKVREYNSHHASETARHSWSFLRRR